VVPRRVNDSNGAWFASSMLPSRDRVTRGSRCACASNVASTLAVAVAVLSRLTGSGGRRTAQVTPDFWPEGSLIGWSRCG
jgi:hypothetical protein